MIIVVGSNYDYEMKKILIYILIFFLSIRPSLAQEFVDEFDEEDEELGLCAQKSYSEGVGFSMMGWGVAIAVTVAILGVVLNQSIAHSDSSQAANSSQGTGSSQQ